MKIIDKTPFVDEKGNLGFQQRVQGMLQFGFSWPKDLEVQKAIVTFFDRQLEKGYTLIRNMPLGSSGIVIPIVLLGPTGIYVIYVANFKGRYQAEGEKWNVEAGNGYKPAPVNLIKETLRMARALKAFIERQGTRLPAEIEPVLIAGDPGLHIESNHPAVRVMMIDGIKSFVNGIATGQPVMGAESVFELSERILNPRPPRKETPEAAAPTLPPQPRASWESEPPQQEVSRARAIFDAADQAQPFSMNDFDFAMSDEEPLPEIPPVPVTPPAVSSIKSARPKKQRIMGMEMWQIAVIVVLVLCLISVVVGGLIFAPYLVR